MTAPTRVERPLRIPLSPKDPPGAPPRPNRPPLTRREKVLRQRRRRRRIIISFVVLLTIANLAVGGIYVYVKWRLGQINRVDVPGLSEDTSSVMNVLLVGSDSRERLQGEAAEQAGKGQEDVSGQRSDTIMILHIDSRQKKAAILSIPRDLYVPIAGTSRSDKVNAAFSLGGPAQLIATIQDGLGIEINHFAEVDFVGFADIVNAVGGVSIYVPAPARDAFSGLEIGAPGCIPLDGTGALAWVRSRHYEYLENGKWQTDVRGDLGRIQRQQDFMRRVMKKAVSSGLSNPLKLNTLIGIGVNNITLDKGMSTPDITRLARRFNSLDPDKVETLTLPGDQDNIGGASVMLLNKPEAQPLIDRINGKGPPPPPEPPVESEGPPTTVKAGIDVRVLNGNGVTGAAAEAATELKSFGYNVTGTGDAPADTDTTFVRYRPGAADMARQLQGSLRGGADIQEDKSLDETEMVVTLGKDFSGLKGQPGATTTTVTLLPAPVPEEAPPPPSC